MADRRRAFTSWSGDWRSSINPISCRSSFSSAPISSRRASSEREGAGSGLPPPRGNDWWSPLSWSVLLLRHSRSSSRAMMVMMRTQRWSIFPTPGWRGSFFGCCSFRLYTHRSAWCTKTTTRQQQQHQYYYYRLLLLVSHNRILTSTTLTLNPSSPTRTTSHHCNLPGVRLRTKKQQQTQQTQMQAPYEGQRYWPPTVEEQLSRPRGCEWRVVPAFVESLFFRFWRSSSGPLRRCPSRPDL